MRYGLYARKSTEEDERQVQSLGDQKSLCLELARRLGVREADIVLLEEARSAKEPGRPEFNRMIQMVDRGELESILAWHPDRLSRNEIDAAAITMRARKGIIKDLKFVNYEFNNSPEGIMMLQFALSQSQYSSSKLSVDVKRGLTSKIDKGWSPHRARPGYMNDTLKEKGNKTISPDPERFPLIRRAFDYLLAGGYTPKQVLYKLNYEWGYRSRPTKKGGHSPMSKSVFYSMLISPFYAGLFVHNGQTYPGSHQPMLTLREHDRMLEIMGVKTRIKPKKHVFAFTGLMRCAQCDKLITAQVTTNRYGTPYIYYRCQTCHGQVISEPRLRAQIMTEVERVSVVEEEFLFWAVEAIERYREEDAQTTQIAVAQKRSSLASIQGQLENLLTALTKGLITDEEYQKRKTILQTDRDRLTLEVDAVEAQQLNVKETLRNVVQFIANVKKWTEVGDEALQKACLHAMASNFRLERKTLLLEPHPLLVGIREKSQELAAEYRAIKLTKTLSESTKKECLALVCSTWSSIWDYNQTLALQEGLCFPNIQKLVDEIKARKPKEEQLTFRWEW